MTVGLVESRTVFARGRPDTWDPKTVKTGPNHLAGLGFNVATKRFHTHSSVVDEHTEHRYVKVLTDWVGGA